MSFLQNIIDKLNSYAPKKSEPNPTPAPAKSQQEIKAEPKPLISRNEILMGRDKAHPLTPQMEDNLQKLLVALNKFRQAYGKPLTVSSGYRPAEFNMAAGGAKKSNHMICLACDFADMDGQIDKWCMANLNKLEEFGLYLEHPDATPNWCHLQVVAPKSGNRVFKP